MNKFDKQFGKYIEVMEETGDTPQAVYNMLCEQLLINAKKVPKLEQQYVKSFLKRMPEVGKMIRHQQNQK